MATVGGSGWVTVGESGGWVVGASVSHTLEPKPFRAQATLFCSFACVRKRLGVCVRV